MSRTKKQWKLKEPRPVCGHNKKTDRLSSEYKSVIHDVNWVKQQKEVLVGRNKKQKPVRPIKSTERKQLFENYNTFLKSNYWKRIRTRVLIRDKRTCQKCGSKIKLHVHHKTYQHHGLEHNHLGDLITLCDLCHSLEHSML